MKSETRNISVCPDISYIINSYEYLGLEKVGLILRLGALPNCVSTPQKVAAQTNLSPILITKSTH
jgi:hypothetical protein